jgi:hypothetical protein
MFRFLTLLLLVACAVDNPGVAAPAPKVPVPVPKIPDPVPVPTPPVQPPAPGTLVLAATEQAEIASESDATLRYDTLVNDSRCPAGVQCVWAGEVRLGLTLTVGGKAESFELASARDNRKIVQGYAIELLDFGPCPLGHSAVPTQECASLKATPAEPAGA